MNSRRTMEGVRVVLSTLVEEHRQFATELLQDRRTAMFYGKQSYDKESADQTFNLWLTMAAEKYEKPFRALRSGFLAWFSSFELDSLRCQNINHSYVRY